MPNVKILKEKQKIVEELSAKLKSQAGVLVNYSGISVNEDTEMRVKMREANVDYSVVKNTLMKFAIKNVGFEELDPVLNGPTSLAISHDDPIAPARIIREYADKFSGYFEIKAGFMDGKVLSAGEVNALAAIPPLPVLRAQLLGTMLAPIASLAVVLKAIAEKGGEASKPEHEAPEAESAPVELAVEAVPEAPAEVTVTAEPAAEPSFDAAPAAQAEEAAPAEPVSETGPEAPAAEDDPAEPKAKAPARKPAAKKAADSAPAIDAAPAQ